MGGAGKRRQDLPWRGFLLGGLVLVSALAIVMLSYQNRILYRAWQGELERTGALELEWRRLLLEESAWLGRARIEKLARDELDMIVPRGDRVRALRLERETPR